MAASVTVTTTATQVSELKSQCTISTQTDSVPVEPQVLDDLLHEQQQQQQHTNQTTQTSASPSPQDANDPMEELVAAPLSSHRRTNPRHSFNSLLQIADSALHDLSIMAAPAKQESCRLLATSGDDGGEQGGGGGGGTGSGEGLHLLSMLAAFTQKHLGGSYVGPPSPDINQNYNGPKPEYFASEDYIPMRKQSRENSAVTAEEYPVGSVFKIGTGKSSASVCKLFFHIFGDRLFNKCFFFPSDNEYISLTAF